jgi:hypothetical protein
MRPVIIALALALPPAVARAQDTESPAPEPPEGVSIRGSLGVLKPKSGQAKGEGFALGIELERRLQWGLRYGFDLTLYGVDFRTPQGLGCGAFCTVDPTMSLDVIGLGGTVGYGKQVGIADFYVGAGAGLYFSTMSATENVLGFPGTHDEKDTSPGADLRAGISLAVSDRTSLGIQVRRLAASGSFGQLGSMPVGGSFVLLTLATCLPHCARQ